MAHKIIEQLERPVVLSGSKGSLQKHCKVVTEQAKKKGGRGSVSLTNGRVGLSSSRFKNLYEVKWPFYFISRSLRNVTILMPAHEHCLRCRDASQPSDNNPHYSS